MSDFSKSGKMNSGGTNNDICKSLHLFSVIINWQELQLYSRVGSFHRFLAESKGQPVSTLFHLSFAGRGLPPRLTGFGRVEWLDSNWEGSLASTKLVQGQPRYPILGNEFQGIKALTRGIYFVNVAAVSKHPWPS
jgi:hypothetical protein